MKPDETRELIEWFDRTRPVMEQHRDTGCEIEQLTRTGAWVMAKPGWVPYTEYRVKPQKPRKIIFCPKEDSEFAYIELTPEVLDVLKEAGLID